MSLGVAFLLSLALTFAVGVIVARWPGLPWNVTRGVGLLTFLLIVAGSVIGWDIRWDYQRIDTPIVVDFILSSMLFGCLAVIYLLVFWCGVGTATAVGWARSYGVGRSDGEPE
jgi:hypothetical protein